MYIVMGIHFYWTWGKIQKPIFLLSKIAYSSFLQSYFIYFTWEGVGEEVNFYKKLYWTIVIVPLFITNWNTCVTRVHFSFLWRQKIIIIIIKVKINIFYIDYK